MLNDECRDHHFSDSDGRCWRCGIKQGYMMQAIFALNNWPKEDKKTESFKKQMDGYVKCKPHTHEVGSTTCSDKGD